MSHLYLIRHADYIYDLVDEQYPKRNLGLSLDGHKEAELLKKRLETGDEIKPDVLISSTERGARETTDIIAPALNKEIIFDEDFEEWRSEDGTLSTEEFMGAWNSLTDEEKPYYRWVEGCETLIEFSMRVHVALNRVLREHQDKTIVIITHGAFIQASFAYFFGFSGAVPQRAAPEIRRTSITHWYKSRTGRWILERSNDYHHLL